MRDQMRLRLICAAVGIAVLAAFDALIFLLDHSSLRLAEWPLPLILLAFILCPSILLIGILALGGSVSAIWWALASLINGAIYAAIGPVFWRLFRNIRESIFN
jgi:hypothetical protein